MDSTTTTLSVHTPTRDYVLKNYRLERERDAGSQERQPDEDEDSVIDIGAEYRSATLHLETLLRGLPKLDRTRIQFETLRLTARWLADAAASMTSWTLDIGQTALEAPLSLGSELTSVLSNTFEEIKVSSSNAISDLQSTGDFDPSERMQRALQTLRDLTNAIQMQMATSNQIGPLQPLNSFIEDLAQQHMAQVDASIAAAPAYKHNSIGKYEIRLFHLLRGNEDQMIHGYIKAYDFITHEGQYPQTDTAAKKQSESDGSGGRSTDAMPQYSTLSYCCDDSSATEDILVLTDSLDGLPSKLKVTADLAEGLKELRRTMESNTLKLWIDAICVDQQKASERNIQSLHMVDIFARASRTYIWLGTEASESSRAINYAKNISNIEKVTEDFKHATNGFNAEIVSLHHLLNRNWFRRRWVVQELCLARDAMVLCGKDRISWKELEEAISLFSIFSMNTKTPSPQGKSVTNLDSIITSSAFILINILNTVSFRDEGGLMIEHKLTLEALMSTLAGFPTTNPRDAVYALLWLASDCQNPTVTRTQPETPVVLRTLESPHFGTSMTAEDAIRIEDSEQYQDIPIDYNESVYEVYAAFLRHVFKRSNSIDILCYPWAMKPSFGFSNRISTLLREDVELPTWMLTTNVHKAELHGGSWQTYLQSQPEPLVGRPGRSSRRYRACGNVSASGTREPFINTRDRTLEVSGFMLGTLRDTQSSANNGIIPGSWLEQMGWLDEVYEGHAIDYREWVSRRSPKGRPDWIWRLLVADRSIHGLSGPPSGWRHFFAWLVDHRIHEDELDTNPKPYDSDIVSDLKFNIRANVWERRLARICDANHQQGLYALVPHGARDGDTVCILAGCSVPVILRLQQPSPSAIEQEVHSQLGISSEAGQANGLDSRTPNGSTSKVQKSTEQIRSINIKDQRFRFVGEAYVHGMMNGQAYRYVSEGGIDFRPFVMI